jgi:hypothetical protein
MSLLLVTDGSRDIVCPKCEHQHGYEWDNEYSDPEVGRHDVECLSCGAPFRVEVTMKLSVYDA